VLCSILLPVWPVPLGYCNVLDLCCVHCVVRFGGLFAARNVLVPVVKNLIPWALFV
jgi:hypothetical protein